MSDLKQSNTPPAESLLKTRLAICSGCDACGLRCAAGTPANAQENATLQEYLAALSPEAALEVQRVKAQNKTVDLGDGVTVTLCLYRDMERGRCVVYPARPLMCRLLGHVEWMPCPIERVPTTLPTEQALKLMARYAETERRSLEAWNSDSDSV